MYKKLHECTHLSLNNTILSNFLAYPHKQQSKQINDCLGITSYCKFYKIKISFNYKIFSTLAL